MNVNIREVPLDEIVDLKVHPAADVWPMAPVSSNGRETGKPVAEGISLAELADSITENGQLEPIVLWDNGTETILLDGRNRRAACVLGKIETVLVEDFVGDGSGGTEAEAERYIRGMKDRIDPTPGQRALAAARYWEEYPESLPERRADAAYTLSVRYRVGESYVARAHGELVAIKEAWLKAAEYEARIKELREIERDAEAKLALAKASGDSASEAAGVRQRAFNSRIDLEQRLEATLEEANGRQRQMDRVDRRETFSSVFQVRKTKAARSSDPVTTLRTSINSSLDRAIKSVEELAEISGRGGDNFNFTARKLSEFIGRFEAAFDVKVD